MLSYTSLIGGKPALLLPFFVPLDLTVPFKPNASKGGSERCHRSA